MDIATAIQLEWSDMSANISLGKSRHVNLTGNAQFVLLA
jgi:hypothetical protein